MNTLFETRDLRKRFHGLVATDHVSLRIRKGEIHALIGPNGAGKSTLVNLISGLLPADGGEILLDGKRLDGMPAHARVDAGLSRCFQVTSVYPALTVAENLILAAQSRTRNRMRPWGTRGADAGLSERARALAERVGLGMLLNQVAGTLAHGAQRQLDVALALAAQPKLLLLDEPMAGMGPEESTRMASLIQSLRGESAILLIEHDMSAVFKLADQITVLVYGRVIATGSVEEIRASKAVQDVYLGSEVHA